MMPQMLPLFGAQSFFVVLFGIMSFLDSNAIAAGRICECTGFEGHLFEIKFDDAKTAFWGLEAMVYIAFVCSSGAQMWYYSKLISSIRVRDIEMQQSQDIPLSEDVQRTGSLQHAGTPLITASATPLSTTQILVGEWVHWYTIALFAGFGFVVFYTVISWIQLYRVKTQTITELYASEQRCTCPFTEPSIYFSMIVRGVSGLIIACAFSFQILTNIFDRPTHTHAILVQLHHDMHPDAIRALARKHLPSASEEYLHAAVRTSSYFADISASAFSAF